MYRKKMINMILFLFGLLFLTGCNGEIIRGIGKDPSYYTDIGVIETYTDDGVYVGQIDETVFEIKVDNEILKFVTQVEDRETLKGLSEGENLTITYSGPPNIDQEYLLEEITIH